MILFFWGKICTTTDIEKSGIRQNQAKRETVWNLIFFYSHGIVKIKLLDLNIKLEISLESSLCFFFFFLLHCPLCNELSDNLSCESVGLPSFCWILQISELRFLASCKWNRDGNLSAVVFVFPQSRKICWLAKKINI